MSSSTGPAPVGGTVDHLLVFLTTSCTICKDHWGKIGSLVADLAPGAGLAVVTPSRSMEDELLARRLTPAAAYLHMDSGTWFMYGVGQAGTCLLVRTPHGGPPPWAEAGQVLGSALPSELGQLPELVRHWQRQAPSVAGAAGEPAADRPCRRAHR